MTTTRVELGMGDDERAFLQRRIRFYALISCGIICSFFLLDVVIWQLFAPALGLEDLWPHQLNKLRIEVGLATGLLIAATALKKGRWSIIPLYAFDGIVTMLVCIALSFLAYQTPQIELPVELMVFLAIQTFLFVHAAVVPAPSFRTFIMHTITCVPLFVVALHRANLVADTDPLAKWGTTAAIGVWALTFAVVGAILSKVIFRLRLSIKKAMKFGQYRVEHKLGEGGMGVVYLAQHALLRRPTAIKLLRRDKVGETTIQRFEREVRNTSRLSHPNTVAIYDYGRTPEGVFYYAMELLDGANLAQIVELDGPMPAERVVHILVQCAGALAEAHSMGLVHRDVKPENIVLCHRGGVPDVVKILDFGLVKDLQTTEETNLSRTDALTGTPLYMPPEVIAAPGQVDGRSDLYSLGGVAWFLLVGRPPFEGKSVVEVCAKHLEETPARPSTVAPVPADLEAIVMRLLEKSPEKRFATAAELEDALRMCDAFGRWSRRKAESWWQANGSDVSTAMDHGRATALTIDIDRA